MEFVYLFILYLLKFNSLLFFFYSHLLNILFSSEKRTRTNLVKQNVIVFVCFINKRKQKPEKSNQRVAYYGFNWYPVLVCGPLSKSSHAWIPCKAS